MKKTRKKEFLMVMNTVTGLSLFIFDRSAVHAVGNLGSALGNLGTAGQQAGTSNQADVGSLVGTIINGALTLVGTIFFILMVYAGYLWLTSRGEEEKVDKAKDIIRASIIGLVVVLSAYAITVFVTGRFSSGPSSGGGQCHLFRNNVPSICAGSGIDCQSLGQSNCQDQTARPVSGGQVSNGMCCTLDPNL